MSKGNFVAGLIKLLQDETGGCNVQHAGCPCRTCFYDFAEHTLKLSDGWATDLWQIILVLRGDYTEEEIEKMKEMEGEK